MNPQIAIVVYGMAILALFALGRDSKARTSLALWIPVLWLAIGASRNVSAWFTLSAQAGHDGAYVEGNAADQVILSGLILLGIVVLVRRRLHLTSFIRSNAPVVLYFLYCGLSILWSDYSGVASRRWLKSFGDLIMVVVVLTDGDRMLAIRRLLGRVGFVLVPISLLFIKYYPNLGRAYDMAGNGYWSGVGTDKNALGLACLIFGLPAVWYLLDPQAKSGTRRMVPILTHVVFLGMALWLLQKSKSATSLSCFLVGSGVMAVVTRRAFAQRRAVVHLLVVGVLTLTTLALFASSMNLLGYVGRDSTLTGRTDIWREALAVATRPLLGAGYESFWVGDRLEAIQSHFPNPPNQAHNGYLEIYLNLGWMGIAFLTLLLVSGYRRTIAAVVRREPAAALGLAYFVTTCIYNCTEASFKMMHPVWITFLLATTAVAEPETVAAAVSKPGYVPNKGGRKLRTFRPALARTDRLQGRAL